MIKLQTDFRKHDFAIHAAASAPGSCPETHADTVLWNLAESRFIATDGRMLVAIEFPQRWPTVLGGTEIVMMRVAGVKALYTKLHQKDVVYQAIISDSGVTFSYRGQRKGNIEVDENFGVQIVEGTPLKYHEQLAVDHAKKARSWENVNPTSLATIGAIFPEDLYVQMHTREAQPVFLHTYDPETHRAYNALLMPAIIRAGHCSEMRTDVVTVPESEWIGGGELHDHQKKALASIEDKEPAPIDPDLGKTKEPKCKACGDTGKNSKGKPCGPCKSKKIAKPKADEPETFDIPEEHRGVAFQVASIPIEEPLKRIVLTADDPDLLKNVQVNEGPLPVPPPPLEPATEAPAKPMTADDL